MKKLATDMSVPFNRYGLKWKTILFYFYSSAFPPFYPFYRVRSPYRVIMWLKSGITKIVASGKPAEVILKTWYNGHIENEGSEMIDAISTKKLSFIFSNTEYKKFFIWRGMHATILSIYKKDFFLYSYYMSSIPFK